MFLRGILRPDNPVLEDLLSANLGLHLAQDILGWEVAEQALWSPQNLGGRRPSWLFEGG